MRQLEHLEIASSYILLSAPLRKIVCRIKEEMQYELYQMCHIDLLFMFPPLHLHGLSFMPLIQPIRIRRVTQLKYGLKGIIQAKVSAVIMFAMKIVFCAISVFPPLTVLTGYPGLQVPRSSFISIQLCRRQKKEDQGSQKKKLSGWHEYSNWKH